MRLLPLFLASLLATAAQAQAVYKCSAGGSVSYADHPCAGAVALAPPSAAGISLGDAGGPQGGDARSLLALEKARIARERHQARQLREQAREARAARAVRQRCERLRLRQRWAEEDLRRMPHGGPRDAALRKLRRGRESLAVECPA